MPTERVLGLDEQLFAGQVRRARAGGPQDGPGGHLGRMPSWDGLFVLDHGSGDGILEAPLEARGATHVGLDPFSARADLLAQGEAIPLADESVDVVISQAVLHLVPHPWRDVAEIARVLRPGGRLLAYVAFGESFQESSTFHVSHRGLELLCREAGLELTEIRPASRALDYQAATTFLPMGVLRPLHRPLRAAVRGLARASSAFWSAAFAARRCMRTGDWAQWPGLRSRWAWYFDLALASGFEVVAVKPGTFAPRPHPPALDDLLRCPLSGEPLHAEGGSLLVSASRAHAYPVRGAQRCLRTTDRTAPPPRGG